MSNANDNPETLPQLPAGDGPQDAQLVRAPNVGEIAPMHPHQLATAPVVTPEQSRVDSVSRLLSGAYDKATSVELTDAEATQLCAPLAESDYQLGAGGDPNLLYAKHTALRGRLDKVFKPLRWSLIERKRFAEEQGNCVHVFSDCVLVVRGAFVAEAVGRMDYWKNNSRVCYDDAAEGAKTNALRRCCKAIGVGLEAWDKDFCETWKRRHIGRILQRSSPPEAESAPPPPPKQNQKPAAPDQGLQQVTWDELANDYDAAHAGGTPARTLDMNVIRNWAINHTSRYAVDSSGTICRKPLPTEPLPKAGDKRVTTAKILSCDPVKGAKSSGFKITTAPGSSHFFKSAGKGTPDLQVKADGFLGFTARIHETWNGTAWLVDDITEMDDIPFDTPKQATQKQESK